MFGRVITPTPDYSKFALANGGHGERVQHESELGPAIKRALQAIKEGRSAILDICMTP